MNIKHVCVSIRATTLTVLGTLSKYFGNSSEIRYMSLGNCPTEIVTVVHIFKP